MAVTTTYAFTAASDPEVPELTEAQVAAMRPASEVVPAAILEGLAARRRGRPPSEHPKVSLTLRLDQDVIEALRAEVLRAKGRA